MVTRYELLWLVGQLAKKARVVRNPTRGVVSTISVVFGSRSLGSSQKVVWSSPARGVRTVTIRQVFQSSGVNSDGSEGAPWQGWRLPNSERNTAVNAFWPITSVGSAHAL